MNFKKAGIGGLTFVFAMVAADMVMAGGLGMIGAHGLVVDGGLSLGQELGVPQVDWLNLGDNVINGNWDQIFLDASTDPCLAAGGHYHGSFCHYGSDGAGLTSLSDMASNTSSSNDVLTYE